MCQPARRIRYRFNEAVKAKGDDARWHISLIAQQVRDAFAARGIDALAIGLLCYDEWDATEEVPGTPEVRDDEAEVVTPAYPAVPAREAGSRYGLRYDECQAIEAAYQRRQIERAAERERVLEDRLAAMEAAVAQLA